MFCKGDGQGESENKVPPQHPRRRPSPKLLTTGHEHYRELHKCVKICLPSHILPNRKFCRARKKRKMSLVQRSRMGTEWRSKEMSSTSDTFGRTALPVVPSLRSTRLRGGKSTG